MQKYQKLFLERTNNTVEEWKNRDFISNSELYRLLHSIKGTALSIGLDQLTHIAERILYTLDEEVERNWSREEWPLMIQEVLYFLDREIAPSSEATAQPASIDKKVAKKKTDQLILLMTNDIQALTNLKDKLEGEGWTVLVTVNNSKAISIIYNKKPDCIVIENNLIDIQTLEEMTSIIDKGKELLIPTLILSEISVKEVKIKAYNLGISDFITQPIDADELLARIRNKLDYKDLMRHSILLDELTGAFNRNFLTIEMKRLLKEENGPADQSIALIDLDHCKNINDTYSHSLGDNVLKTLSNIIMKEMRSSDYLVRFSGEEFVLVMPGLTGEQAVSHIESFKRSFSKVEFNKEESPFTCTFSAGVYQIQNQSEQLDTIIQKADKAMYQAKQEGRNQVILYSNTVTTKVNKTKYLRIGIVDDDMIIHNILTDYLTSFTFADFKIEIKTFREGESFFESEWYKQEGKFIILLDGIMPRMDGIEVLKKIRKECPEEDFIIIMITGRKNEKDIIKALEFGADDYITKPFNIKELEARIKRLAMRLL